MEWGIFGVYGSFGSWKSLISSVMMIDKLKQWDIVFSNILLNKSLIPNPENYFYFDDFEEFVEILKFSGYFAIEMWKENVRRAKLWIDLFPRVARPRFNVFFDEMGIFANSANYKEIHKEYGQTLYDYLLQCRKCFMSIYCIAQKPKLIASQLRQHIQYWYTYKALWWNKRLGENFGYIVIQDLDPDTFQIESYKDMRQDEKWNFYQVDILLQYNHKFMYFRKKYFKYYDDLYMNKTMEVVFKWDYLARSWFLDNLANSRINNYALKVTKKLYEPLTKDIQLVNETNTSYLWDLKALYNRFGDLFRRKKSGNYNNDLQDNIPYSIELGEIKEFQKLPIIKKEEKAL